MFPGVSRSSGSFHATLLLLSAILMAAITGCINDGGDELDLVVVSIAPQREIVERIAGADIEVILMVPQNMDPHTFSPNPSQLLKVARADIYFKMGSGIEFEELNMDTIIETNRGMKVIDMSEGIDVVSYEDHGVKDEHNEAEHDDHTGTDPHVWLDPVNMLVMADTVLEALISEDPDKEELFRVNHASYVDDLVSVIGYARQNLSPYGRKAFLTYHPAWGYFADSFNLTQMSVEEGGKEPGPQGIASLIEQARNNNITVIFVEPQFDTSIVQQIADAIGGKVVTVDPLAGDYIENIRKVTGDMVEGFDKGEGN
ncbi:MAG: zinc ABC transporter substrate-binding protein [Candidatus Thermoplasmatota archaeon]|nr:zinc ABC transporter substrate-binding protein [Candidatus Thermoplasmatota archaeon]